MCYPEVHLGGRLLQLIPHPRTQLHSLCHLIISIDEVVPVDFCRLLLRC